MTNSDIRKLLMAKVADAERFYKKRMNEQCKHKYADPGRLNALDESCVLEAVEHFNRISSGFSLDDRDEYETILNGNLRRMFHRYLNENESRKEELRAELTKESDKAKRTYSDIMDKAVKGSAVVDIQKVHELALAKAMEYLNAVEVGLGADLKQEAVSDLYTTVCQQKDSYLRMNRDKVDDRVVEAKNAAIVHYKRIMSEKANASYLDAQQLDTAHRRAQEAAISKLKSLKLGSRVEREVSEITSETSELKLPFQRLSLEKAVESFNKRKNLALAAYKHSMTQREIRNLTKEDFQLFHAVCKMAALKAFEESGPHEPVSEFNKVGQDLLNQMQEFARQLLLEHLRADLATEFLRMMLR